MTKTSRFVPDFFGQHTTIVNAGDLVLRWLTKKSYALKATLVCMQAVSETLTHKVMREARAQQEELDAEDRPAGNVFQVCLHNHFRQFPLKWSNACKHTKCQPAASQLQC